MKRFLKNILFFAVPVIAWMIIEGMLPITTFTFRHFEAVSFETDVPHASTCYPNINSRMSAVGDLCHHTSKAIVKKETWITDQLGFRNTEFIEQADILFIGDSFIMGTSLSQEQTLSSKVAAKLGNKAKVYNMAPSSMFEFNTYLTSGVIKKPRLLVFSIVEREVPPVLDDVDLQKAKAKEKDVSFFGFSKLNVFLDKALKGYSIDWLKARIYNSKGNGIPAVGNADMFFFKGVEENHDSGDLLLTANIIIAYKKYCDSLGIDFLFLPMPNKETVYYELVPFANQPDYLTKLDSVLVANKVATVNSVKLYNDYRQKNQSLLYYLDDTHWNSNGTEVIADEIVKRW